MKSLAERQADRAKRRIENGQTDLPITEGGSIADGEFSVADYSKKNVKDFTAGLVDLSDEQFAEIVEAGDTRENATKAIEIEIARRANTGGSGWKPNA